MKWYDNVNNILFFQDVLEIWLVCFKTEEWWILYICVLYSFQHCEGLKKGREKKGPEKKGPEKRDQKSTTRLGMGAFQNCQGVTNIIFFY